MSRVAVIQFSCPDLLLTHFSHPGWSFHQVELMGQDMKGAQKTRGKLFNLFFFISGELILVFLSFTHFPVKLQHLWMQLPFCGHSDVNLSWELCPWHGPVLIPLFQTRWHRGRPPLFSQMWLNLANRLRTALGGDAHKKPATPAAAETFPFTTSADF